MGDMTVTIEAPDALAASAARGSSLVLKVAERMEIASPADYRWAADELRQVKTKMKELDSDRRKITSKLDAAKKSIMDLFREPLQFLADAETVIKRKMLAWQQEEERKRREAEALARENQRKEQERLQAQAKKAEQRGKVEQAEALRQQADATPAIAPPAPQKVAGLSAREDWEAEVVDKMALVKAVAAGKVPIEALDVNMPLLNKMARALKQSLAWDGVKARAVQRIASRS